jgi:hypothetical protein
MCLSSLGNGVNYFGS